FKKLQDSSPQNMYDVIIFQDLKEFRDTVRVLTVEYVDIHLRQIFFELYCNVMICPSLLISDHSYPQSARSRLRRQFQFSDLRIILFEFILCTREKIVVRLSQDGTAEVRDRIMMTENSVCKLLSCQSPVLAVIHS